MIDMSNVAKDMALPEELQAFAEERVRSGEYASVSEVAQEAFRLLQQRDKLRKQAREDLVAMFREMEDSGELAPSDDELEQAVQSDGPKTVEHRQRRSPSSQRTRGICARQELSNRPLPHQNLIARNHRCCEHSHMSSPSPKRSHPRRSQTEPGPFLHRTP